MDDDYEGIEDGPVSRRARPLDFLVTLIVFFRDLVSSVETLFSNLVDLTAWHANYKTDQQVFLDETRVEIDSLPTTET